MVAQPKQALGAMDDPSLHILAVDDDPLVLINTVMMLEDLGHRVTEASSGQTALELLGPGLSVDLVITDHKMSGMTGAELARAILDRFPDLPILVATGYAELPEVDLPRLGKPFDQRGLAEAITRIIKVKHDG